MHETTESVLQQLGLSLASVPNLPPEVRDQLLGYVQLWGAASEQLELAEALRAVHGPLLFLLDYQAQALYRLGRYAEALEFIERRQRRSTSVVTQMREAMTLSAAGHTQQALAVATDLVRAYPRHSTAVCVAAEILATLGNVEQANAALAGYLAYRPHDVTAALARVFVALHTEGKEAAGREFQLLGAGIPAGIVDADLQRLHLLAERLGNRETAQAAHLELERRRRQELAALQALLAPFVDESAALVADPEAFYRHFSGPESVPVSMA